MKINNKILQGFSKLANQSIDSFNIYKELRESKRLLPDDLVKKIEDCFHGKAFVDIAYGEKTYDTILITLDDSCYSYFKKFTDEYLSDFSFESIFKDYEDYFKYEDEGYSPNGSNNLFSFEITFDGLYDLVIGDTTLKEIIENTVGSQEERADNLTDLYSNDIAKIFGGISKEEVKFLLYRLVENLE